MCQFPFRKLVFSFLLSDLNIHLSPHSLCLCVRERDRGLKVYGQRLRIRNEYAAERQ